MEKRERTVGELRKCSMRMEGNSTKSVAQRVPETFWYSVRPSMAGKKTYFCLNKLNVGF
jgi:hypothetical protein